MSRQNTSTTAPSTTRRSLAGAPLVIVESPNKVATISRILGKGFTVRASYGHIADIAARQDAVDVAAGFAAPYYLSKKGAEVVRNLSRDLASASELILATDDDREGEMIAHLLVHFLQPTVPVSRIVFGAITEREVQAALENRRTIDPRIVDAARARRILDHLWGFRMSPVLWEKVRGGLGAGRVQNPALRLVVEREWERRAFVPAVFCGVNAVLDIAPRVVAALVSVDGVKVATSKDFDDAGRITGEARCLGRDEADNLVSGLAGVDLVVESVSHSAYTRRPRRPYVTSDLLSDIVNRLGVGSARAQALVNQLFEKGLITYPRTDNPALSREATTAARAVAVEMFGATAVPERPNRWFAKKGAQLAHEAIHPTSMRTRTITGLTRAHVTVYEMIWRRTVASQMVDATGTTTSVVLVARDSDGLESRFRASGTTITVPGHRQVFSHPDDDEPTPLATFVEGDTVGVSALEVGEHTTRPPARYTESSLITALEEHGIGRPSTYAATMEALRREYVWSRRGDRSLLPTVTGVAVHGFLSLCFPEHMDLGVTARLEERLERVATGAETLEGVLTAFLLEGDTDWPALESAIATVRAEHDPATRPVVVLGEHPRTGELIELRPGKTFARRTGKGSGSGAPYLRCGERNIPVSDRIDFAAFGLDQAVALVDVPREGRVLGEHAGEQVLLKVGRFGPWLEHSGVRVSLAVDDVATMDMTEALVRLEKRKSGIPGRVQS